ncbi:hypothetical protein BGX31_007006 [Mortierella sp. GBA43]|nr:hypothetical protein BGX31_007006 [Mortierella sp. GBA43]
MFIDITFPRHFARPSASPIRSIAQDRVMSFGPLLSVAVNTPELLLHVTEYLDPRDVVCWMATCKTLATLLEPRLWRHITIDDNTPPRETMSRNCHFIRTLRIYHVNGYMHNQFEFLSRHHGSFSGSHGNTIKVGRGGQSTAHLHTLTLTSFPTDQSIQHTIVREFVALAQRSHQCLRILTLPAAVLTQKGPIHAQIRDTLLNKLPNLTKLTICNSHRIPWTRRKSDYGGHQPWTENSMVGVDSFVPCDIVFPFLLGCFQHPRLVSLHCLFRCSGSFEPTSFQDLAHALKDTIKSKEVSRIPQLRDLFLPSIHPGYGHQHLVPLLRAFGSNLQSMWVSTLSNDYDDLLKQTIEQYCPNLGRLSISRDNNMSLEDLTIHAIIRACRPQGLKSFSIRGLNMWNRSWCKGKVITTLVECHAETLQDVEFVDGDIDDYLQHLILEKCIHLQRMWVGPDPDPCKSRFTCPINTVPSDWGCLGLKELRLTYGPSSEATLKSRHISPDLYKQVGRLRNLEILSLGPDHRNMSLFRHDMTLCKGWLGKLAGLDKLKHLEMISDLWSMMGQRDVEFMDQNWPALQTVSFCCEVAQFSKIKCAPHWKWLQEKRPWLQLTRGYHS